MEASVEVKRIIPPQVAPRRAFDTVMSSHIDGVHARETDKAVAFLIVVGRLDS